MNITAEEFLQAHSMSEQDQAVGYVLKVDEMIELLNEYSDRKVENLSISHVSVSLFNESLRVLRDLAGHQNGAPLIQHEQEYNDTMTEVWDFLEANET